LYELSHICVARDVGRYERRVPTAAADVGEEPTVVVEATSPTAVQYRTEGETVVPIKRAYPAAARIRRRNKVLGMLIGGGIGAVAGALGGNESDPDVQLRLAAFVQALQQIGWTVGRNLRIESRWAAGNANNIRKHAAELAALAPDVILANGDLATQQLQQATRTVPIVFVLVVDPVGAGFVASLAQPGGNATGFTIFEYGMSGKWLELLKEIAPGTTRAAVLRDRRSERGRPPDR